MGSSVVRRKRGSAERIRGLFVFLPARGAPPPARAAGCETRRVRSDDPGRTVAAEQEMADMVIRGASREDARGRMLRRPGGRGADVPSASSARPSF